MRHATRSKRQLFAIAACLFIANQPNLWAADSVTGTTVVTSKPARLVAVPVQATTTTQRHGWIVPPFQILGLTGRVYAPVLEPYDNSSFRTFGGQPATGGDALMEQGARGK